jgi:hypothetical protein
VGRGKRIVRQAEDITRGRIPLSRKITILAVTIVVLFALSVITLYALGAIQPQQ